MVTEMVTVVTEMVTMLWSDSDYGATPAPLQLRSNSDSSSGATPSSGAREVIDLRVLTGSGGSSSIISPQNPTPELSRISSVLKENTNSSDSIDNNINKYLHST